MVGIVVFSALSLLMAFLLGVVLMFDDTEAIPWVFYEVCRTFFVFYFFLIYLHYGNRKIKRIY